MNKRAEKVCIRLNLIAKSTGYKIQISKQKFYSVRLTTKEVLSLKRRLVQMIWKIGRFLINMFHIQTSSQQLQIGYKSGSI